MPFFVSSLPEFIFAIAFLQYLNIVGSKSFSTELTLLLFYLSFPLFQLDWVGNPRYQINISTNVERTDRMCSLLIGHFLDEFLSRECEGAFIKFVATKS